MPNCNTADPVEPIELWISDLLLNNTRIKRVCRSGCGRAVSKRCRFVSINAQLSLVIEGLSEGTQYVE